MTSEKQAAGGPARSRPVADDRRQLLTAATVMACVLASVAGCGAPGGGLRHGGGGSVIRVEGSDTMVNLAQAWAEEYNKSHPRVSVQVSGGGSGVGIASLIDEVTDLANASREMKDKELQRAEEHTGKKPKQIVVALDALAIYVHRKTRWNVIAIEDLAEIYGENGTITKWSQLGVQNVACKSDRSRGQPANNSGTCHISARRCWARTASSSWARSTKAARKTSSP
jgi:phosphate transport system substrate-binding protein